MAPGDSSCDVGVASADVGVASAEVGMASVVEGVTSLEAPSAGDASTDETSLQRSAGAEETTVITQPEN